jgi:hypothetical protein
MSTKPATSTAKKAPANPKSAAPAKPAAKKTATPKAAPAKKAASSREAMLARVESVRLEQRSEGHFDCFGRAAQGYCDQGGCVYHAECLSISRILHEV